MTKKVRSVAKRVSSPFRIFTIVDANNMQQ